MWAVLMGVETSVRGLLKAATQLYPPSLFSASNLIIASFLIALLFSFSPTRIKGLKGTVFAARGRIT